MANKYILEATGVRPSKLPDLVSFVIERKQKKDEIWRKRYDKLVEMSSQLEQLISIYNESEGKVPGDVREKALFYKAALAHQIYNTLKSTKLEPDFIDFAPLGVSHDRDLLLKCKALTKAHRVMRYKGKYDKAKTDAKSDFIWGNSFIELSTHYNPKTDKAEYGEYTHCPFKEFRNLYGDTDAMRIIDMPIGVYASTYGEDNLKKVSIGGITSTETDETRNVNEKEYKTSKDIIQVVRYYDPARLMFVEIHGGNGHIERDLNGKDYPFVKEDGTGYIPIKESRFYDEVNGDYFGWGVMDYIIPLANLETTITNATAMEAIWEAASPSFVYSNDPTDMNQKLQKHFRNINKGINMPIVQKDSGIGTQGQIQSMKKGVDNNNMQVWDETVVSRATRFTGVDVMALSDYAPTAEQQKLKKIESDKLNIRVLMGNEEREKEFATNEMYFLRDGSTTFHNHEIEVVDQIAEDNTTEDGFVPAKKVKIKDILKNTKDLEMTISPRMEGVLDDMDFMEIQTIQDDMAMIQPGTAAYDIAMEKYFGKKNPTWGLNRQDFSTPTMQEAPAAPMDGGVTEPASGVADPTQALTQQL